MRLQDNISDIAKLEAEIRGKPGVTLWHDGGRQFKIGTERLSSVSFKRVYIISYEQEKHEIISRKCIVKFYYDGRTGIGIAQVPEDTEIIVRLKERYPNFGKVLEEVSLYNPINGILLCPRCHAEINREAIERRKQQCQSLRNTGKADSLQRATSYKATVK